MTYYNLTDMQRDSQRSIQEYKTRRRNSFIQRNLRDLKANGVNYIFVVVLLTAVFASLIMWSDAKAATPCQAWHQVHGKEFCLN